MSHADCLLFMTQDAVPEDPHLIRRMMEAMEVAPDVRAAYARQLPRAGLQDRGTVYPPV